MKHIMIMASLLMTASMGAMAQTPATQPPAQQAPASQQTPTTPQTPTSPQTQTSSDPSMPYFSQATYNAMDTNAVPANVASSFGMNYSGVTGTKWEGNNDVYRSSFQQGGKDMSVIYDKEGKVREVRTGMAVTDMPASIQTALNGQNVTKPYEVTVGKSTYYATQVNGKEVLYDSQGKSLTMPKK